MSCNLLGKTRETYQKWSHEIACKLLLKRNELSD